MRALLCCLVAIGLGASEGQLVHRLDDAFDALKKLDTRRAKEVDAAVTHAVTALLADGPIADAGAGPLRAAFNELLAGGGAVVRYDRLGSRIYGAGGQLVYLTISFERGFAFARVVAAPTRDDHTVITLIALSPDPAAILPPDLLLPDPATTPPKR